MLVTVSGAPDVEQGNRARAGQDPTPTPRGVFGRERSGVGVVSKEVDTRGNRGLVGLELSSTTRLFSLSLFLTGVFVSFSFHCCLFLQHINTFRQVENSIRKMSCSPDISPNAQSCTPSAQANTL